MDATFPESVPKLKAENMCKGSYDGPDGTHCLSGWRRVVFPLFFIPLVRAAAIQALRANAGGHEIEFWNDLHSEEESASVWNRAMLALGYIDAGDKFVRPPIVNLQI